MGSHVNAWLLAFFLFCFLCGPMIAGAALVLDVTFFFLAARRNGRAGIKGPSAATSLSRYSLYAATVALSFILSADFNSTAVDL